MPIAIVSPFELATRRFVAAVVVDVLRCTVTVAACAKSGVASIFMAADSQDVVKLLEDHPSAQVIGEDGGRRRIQFRFGNSPSQLGTGGHGLREVILLSSNGTPVMAEAQRATDVVLCGSFANASAVVARLAELGEEPDVALVPASIWTEAEADEDWACCEHLVELISRGTGSAAPYLERVRRAPAARKFLEDDPAFPAADLDWCTRVDWCDDALELDKVAAGVRWRAR